MIKFPDFSLTFQDISSDYLQGIDPRNSSKKTKCMLFHDIFMTTIFYVTTCM